MYDVAVVGLGPAGRALAHRAVASGLRVLAHDPAPHHPWPQTLGLWRHELPCWIPERVIAAAAPHPVIITDERRPLDGTYVVLDNTALRATLDLGGVDIRATALDDAGVLALRTLARVVVDARGAGRWAAPGGPAQTAVGVTVPAEAASPLLAADAGVLMDWRPAPGSDDDPRPSFLYAVPIAPGRVLVEETALAARPPVTMDVLRDRLHRRLAAHGIDAGFLAGGVEEHVHIPLAPTLPAPLAGVVPFGTARAGGHPATGYSIAGSWADVDRLVARIPEVARHPTGTDRTRWLPTARRTKTGDALRRVGLRLLLDADATATRELFTVFAAANARTRRVYMDAGASGDALAAAMLRLFLAAPYRLRREMVSAAIHSAAASSRGILTRRGARRRPVI